MDVIVRCVVCGKTRAVKVNQRGYDRWKKGELIQNALPKLSPADRELLMSGICSSCWDWMFEVTNDD